MLGQHHGTSLAAALWELRVYSHACRGLYPTGSQSMVDLKVSSLVSGVRMISTSCITDEKEEHIANQFCTINDQDEEQQSAMPDNFWSAHNQAQ